MTLGVVSRVRLVEVQATGISDAGGDGKLRTSLLYFFGRRAGAGVQM